jgi:hypothetical protein
MTVTISLSPEMEKQLVARATVHGQDVAGYVCQLIARDIQDARPASKSLDEVLAPIRRQFKDSGMTDEELDALVEETREEIWQEKQQRGGT